jgi:hypothetical protein
VLPRWSPTRVLDTSKDCSLTDIVYYESRKRELKTRPIYECRCDERLKTKSEKSTRLAYTGLLGERNHLHAHREASALTNEIPEESDQFRFFRVTYYGNIKGSVGLILTKVSGMRISIPLDLSSRPFIPLPRFIRRRRPLPLLVPFLVCTPRRSA